MKFSNFFLVQWIFTNVYTHVLPTISRYRIFSWTQKVASCPCAVHFLCSPSRSSHCCFLPLWFVFSKMSVDTHHMAHSLLHLASFTWHIHLRFICIITSILLKLSMHSQVDGHLGYFQLLPTMNRTAVDIHI